MREVTRIYKKIWRFNMGKFALIVFLPILFLSGSSWGSHSASKGELGAVLEKLKTIEARLKTLEELANIENVPTTTMYRCTTGPDSPDSISVVVTSPDAANSDIFQKCRQTGSSIRWCDELSRKTDCERISISHHGMVIPNFP